MIRKAFGIFCFAGLLSLQSVWGAGKTTLVIGYAELDGDPRYREDRRYAGIEFKPRGRPWPGAKVALRESRIVGRAIGIKFRLEKVSVKSEPELAEVIVNGGSIQSGSVEDALNTMKLVYQIYWADTIWREVNNIPNPNDYDH